LKSVLGELPHTDWEKSSACFTRSQKDVLNKGQEARVRKGVRELKEVYDFSKLIGKSDGDARKAMGDRIRGAACLRVHTPDNIREAGNWKEQYHHSARPLLDLEGECTEKALNGTGSSEKCTPTFGTEEGVNLHEKGIGVPFRQHLQR